MPTPRIPINALPDQTSVVNTDLLVVQNGAVTKKITVGLLASGIGGSGGGGGGGGGGGVPAGGSTGNVLVKASNTDFATTWVPHTDGIPPTRRIDTVAPLQGGNDLSANRTLTIDTFTSTVRRAVPPPATIDLTKYLRTDGQWAAPAGGGSGGGITTEDAVDAVAAALGTGGNNIDITYNDAANTITIDVEPLVTGDIAGLDSTLTGKADKSTAITTTAPLTGGGSLAAPLTLGIADFTTTQRGAVPNPATSSGRYLKDDGTWTLPPSASSGGGGVYPFTYNTSTLEAGIGANQVRANNATLTAATKLWVWKSTLDGLDVTVGLGRIKAGFQVYLQDYSSASRYAQFNVVADSVDKGTYFELTVAVVSSAGTIPGGKIALQSLSSAQTSTLFSTTTTAPGLTPGSNGAATSYLRGNGTWAALTKTDVGLGNVDNTSDATKNAATVTLTNKTMSLTNNTITGTLGLFNAMITDADVPAALNGLTGVWIGTQAQYDAIVTKVATVLYAIQP